MDTFDKDRLDPESVDTSQTGAEESVTAEPVAEEPVAAKTASEKLEVSRSTSSGIIMKRLIAAVIALAVVVGCCAVTAAVVNGYWEERMDTMMNSVNGRLQQMQTLLERLEIFGGSVSGTPGGEGGGMNPGQVYARNQDSVVMIASSAFVDGQNVTSTGTGFILTEDGYVVTNHHVINGAESCFVYTSDGVRHLARVIGSDATHDIAVVKFTGQNLNAVTVGSSDLLVVGDQVVAIGNPLGEQATSLTVGYVSALNRTVSTDTAVLNMLQTDCAINSGNSGGPLFNMLGEVVGITTAKISGTSSSGALIEGMSFAIPMDDVIRMIEDLVEYGQIRTAYLGVMVSDMTSATPDGYTGAYVREVTPGYCAEAAGMLANDIIIDVGGYAVTDVNSLSRALQRLNAGQTTTVTVWRNGQILTLDITLDERPQQQTASEEEITLPETGSSADEWSDYFDGRFGGG